MERRSDRVSKDPAADPRFVHLRRGHARHRVAGACAPAASGFVLYPITGEPGDPAPLVDGAEPLWDDTAVGPFIELFGSFQDGLDALGFADADELYTFVLSGCWAGTATAIRTCASRTSPTPTAFPR